VLKTGLYPEIDEDTYHGDPAPQPSLNQSTAKILLERSPRHAWHQHPRLNPDFHRDEDRKFDLGNIAHRLLLGKGRPLFLIDAPDYRTKAAQAGRQIALENGQMPCLTHLHERALRMTQAALKQMRDAGLDFKPETHPEAMTECGFIWQEGDTWFRTKIDRLQGDTVSIDFKTTAAAATDRGIDNMMMDMGWHIQAAFHERALNAALGEEPRRFLFIVQETYAPFALTVTELTEGALAIGRQQLDTAIQIWRACMKANRWPSYNDAQVRRLSCPAWAVQQWESRLHGAPVAAE
jgi:hypothetical protein